MLAWYQVKALYSISFQVLIQYLISSELSEWRFSLGMVDKPFAGRFVARSGDKLSEIIISTVPRVVFYYD